MNISSLHKVIRGLDRRIFSRLYSMSNKFVTVTQNEKTGVSTVSLNRAPVNSLNLELLTELKESLIKIRDNGSKGMILTSSLPTVFSGGLDIMEMYKPDLQRAVKFWTELQETWMMLYGLGLPTVAAVNGASPAGGCLLAISCEYRIFVDGKHKMGLNETKLGIAAPSWFKDTYVATIGNRMAELSLLRGEQFLPQRALEIGLVDELASDKEDALAKAENYIAYYNGIPAAARALTKKLIREPLIEKLKRNQEQDTSIFVGTIAQPGVQKALDLYIESLKKKK